MAATLNMAGTQVELDVVVQHTTESALFHMACERAGYATVQGLSSTAFGGIRQAPVHPCPTLWHILYSGQNG